jgi:hypothetical protein
MSLVHFALAILEMGSQTARLCWHRTLILSISASQGARITYRLFFFYFGWTEVWFRASCLQSRCCTTWATPPVHMALTFSLYAWLVILVCSGSSFPVLCQCLQSTYLVPGICWGSEQQSKCCQDHISSLLLLFLSGQLSSSKLDSNRHWWSCPHNVAPVCTLVLLHWGGTMSWGGTWGVKRQTFSF